LQSIENFFDSISSCHIKAQPCNTILTQFVVL
jgi:hypothetical protein